MIVSTKQIYIQEGEITPGSLFVLATLMRDCLAQIEENARIIKDGDSAYEAHSLNFGALSSLYKQWHNHIVTTGDSKLDFGLRLLSEQTRTTLFAVAKGESVNDYRQLDFLESEGFLHRVIVEGVVYISLTYKGFSIIPPSIMLK